MAGYCNLSPTYFSRKFRLITGQTFKEHVNYIRLRQATQMLLMTDNSITKIAMLCGFGSSNYFKDLFKKFTENLLGNIGKILIDIGFPIGSLL